MNFFKKTECFSWKVDLSEKEGGSGGQFHAKNPLLVMASHDVLFKIYSYCNLTWNNFGLIHQTQL